MKKIIMIILFFLINACGQTPEVLMVQGGKLESCPSKTIEQMVDGFMGFPSWESLVTEDGNNYVNIRNCTIIDNGNTYSTYGGGIGVANNSNVLISLLHKQDL